MTVQAIVTKFYGPTNHRGARIRATAYAGTMWFSYDHSLSTERNHEDAARAYVRKFGWRGHWHGGSMPSGDGNVYVCSSNSAFALWEVDGKFVMSTPLP